MRQEASAIITEAFEAGSHLMSYLELMHTPYLCHFIA